jgi:hypothetical protein
MSRSQAAPEIAAITTATARVDMRSMVAVTMAGRTSVPTSWGRLGFDGGAGSWNACRGFQLLVKPLVNSLTANSDYALAA